MVKNYKDRTASAQWQTKPVRKAKAGSRYHKVVFISAISPPQLSHPTRLSMEYIVIIRKKSLKNSRST